MICSRWKKLESGDATTLKTTSPSVMRRPQSAKPFPPLKWWCTLWTTPMHFPAGYFLSKLSVNLTYWQSYLHIKYLYWKSSIRAFFCQIKYRWNWRPCCMIWHIDTRPITRLGLGGGRSQPQKLASHLNLLREGGADYANHITNPPHDFQTFLRP